MKENITKDVVQDIAAYMMLSKNDLEKTKKELFALGYDKEQVHLAEMFVVRSLFDISFNRSWQLDGVYALNKYVEAKA